MPKMPSPPGENSTQQLATLDQTAAALDEGGGEGVTLRTRAGEIVTFLDKGATRHEVLAPSHESDAEEKETKAHRRAENPRFRVDHVGRAESGHEE
jgi:hypothetical protein